MTHGLYITATEERSGKSVISLGMMEMLMRKVERVGFFRPIIKANPELDGRDNDISLMTAHFNLQVPYEKMFGYTTRDVSKLVSQGKESHVVEEIINRYHQLKEHCDFILCEGTDFAGTTAAFELDVNAELSKNLGCPVLLVASARHRSLDATIHAIEMTLDSLKGKGCQTIGIIVNRTRPEASEEIKERLRQGALTKGQMVYVIPEQEALGKPTVGEIADALGAEVLCGEAQLNRHVYSFTVAAMQLRNFLSRIGRGSLIITPGDRADIIVACLATVSSASLENIAGILLTGGLKPEEPVWNLIKGFPRMVPILSVKKDTFPTTTVVDRIHAVIHPKNDRKITRALALFDKHVDVEALAEKVITTRTNIVTPKMFEFELIRKARVQKQHIVLPEGNEERILRATEILLHREVVDITLLGKKDIIEEKMSILGLRMDRVNIVDPHKSGRFEDYVKTYFEMRKHKGLTEENAQDIMTDVNFFGTMMIHKGDADGMVSGSVHSTAATIRPAFEIIKTKSSFTIVSSVFFMCLADRVLVYGDCAVNPTPNAQQLADIALSSADTAKTFGIEPIVAMLSYSTGESGKGKDVEKVREATKIAKAMAQDCYPDLRIEGPIQYDAAVDPLVAQTKMPKSEVAGRANVFIFPDLNTGNNTYKAVQRSANAVAIGPVLQGLKRPVNDLSRGCTVPDIVNTVAITAIQAQSDQG